MSKLDATIIRAETVIMLAKQQCNSNDINVINLPHQCSRAAIDEHIREGDDNGAWVKAWVWVDFEDTLLDKDEEQPDDDD